MDLDLFSFISHGQIEMENEHDHSNIILNKEKPKVRVQLFEIYCLKS